MRHPKNLVLAVALCAAAFACPTSASAQDVLILGEAHDNAAHHAVQLDWMQRQDVSAVVYEMLTPQEAAALKDVPRTASAMRAATQGFHWPNIADYAALLAASPVISGAALPRDQVRASVSEGAASVFGEGSSTYGLTDPLPADQLATRMDVQFDAHCGAVPREMMGGFVEAQRLRDAAFAREVLEAFDQHGATVVLITGNGHARTDWGVPAALARARPDMRVLSIGQSEDGAVIAGVFDQTEDSPSPDRGDPCAAFK